MYDLLLTGFTAPEMEALDAEETAWIEKFADDPTQLDALRHQVARAVAEITSDLDNIRSSVRSVFDELEWYINDDWGGRKYEAVVQQPRILADALRVSPAMNDFICRGFGQSRGSIGVGKPFLLPINNLSIRDFFFWAFLEEARIVQVSESAPSVEDVLRAIWQDRGQETSKQNYDEWREVFDRENNPTHTFRYGPFHGQVGVQYVYHIKPTHIENFKAEYKKHGPRSGYYGKELVSIKANRLIHIRRIKEEHKLLMAIEDFRTFWIRADFLKEIGIYKIGYVPIIEIENAIYKTIINPHLIDKETLSDPVDEPLSDEPEQGGGARQFPRSLSERLSALDRFAAENPGEPVSDLVMELFPSLVHEAEMRIALPLLRRPAWLAPHAGGRTDRTRH